jgi:DNA-directed RNA polymerase subunit omega
MFKMMLYPPVADLVSQVGSRYLLVNLVARRARDISAIAENQDLPLEKKPVSCAIDEVYTGQLKISGAEYQSTVNVRDYSF